MSDFSGHVAKRNDGFEGVHGGYGFGKRNAWGRRLLEFCDKKELCVANTWFEKEKQRKIKYGMGENKTEIDFALVSITNREYLEDVKAIPRQLQHRLVAVDKDKKK